ncbi:MAG: GTPase ObgE [Oscillospiraceae bacterium]
MFIDKVDIEVRSGNGGNGAVSFHREKYVSAGGPDGGDGGKGGDIILRVDDNLNTLVNFRYKKKYIAQNGENGKRNNCAGKNAEDIIIKVPRGTIVKNKETAEIIADMSNREEFLLAKGGKGGKGNQHFATATRQVPRFAIPGQQGVALNLTLELKLLADVGLVGYPNVGKSTLISKISNAKPKIANYHFTTLTPSLGVVRISEQDSFVVADIPGIIEGASQGQGLGHSFLRHVERCRLLLHVIDVSAADGRNPIEDFKHINYEMAQFNKNLCAKPRIVVANKIDAATGEQVEKLKDYILKQKLDFYLISAATSKGLEELKWGVFNKLKQLPEIETFEPERKVYDMNNIKKAETNEFEVKKEADYLVIKSAKLVRILQSVDIFDYEALQYFEKTLDKMGVNAKLKELGAKNGDTVRIENFDFEFEYIE